MPRPEAKLLILFALAAYAMAGFFVLAGRRPGRKVLGRLGLILLVGGIGLNVAALAVRLARGHLPISSGFDTFTLLAALTGATAGYLKAVDALPSAEVVLPPVAAACSVVAMALSGEAAYRDFARDVRSVAHVSSAIAAAVCFAAAAGSGWFYLRVHKQLRRKDPAVLNSPAPSLERLDRFIRHVLPVGFALLTVTIVTGALGALQPQHERYLRSWWTHPKILVAVGTWFVYAVALHAAYAKRLRIRMAAALSAVGFLLLIAVLLASTLMPKT